MPERAKRTGTRSSCPTGEKAQGVGMKTWLLLLLFAALPLRASTVILSVTGRVSDTNAATHFSTPPVKAGDLWSVTMEYHYPTLASGFLGENTYDDLGGRLLFTVNGLSWEGQHIGGFVGGIFFRASLGSGTSAPPGLGSGGGTSSVSLVWSGQPYMVPDPSSLPENFTQWNLPAADSFALEVFTELSPPRTGWFIHANSWDTMTIQVIPEPSAAGLAGVVAIAVLGRKRSGRV